MVVVREPHLKFEPSRPELSIDGGTDAVSTEQIGEEAVKAVKAHTGQRVPQAGVNSARILSHAGTLQWPQMGVHRLHRKHYQTMRSSTSRCIRIKQVTEASFLFFLLSIFIYSPATRVNETFEYSVLMAGQLHFRTIIVSAYSTLIVQRTADCLG